MQRKSEAPGAELYSDGEWAPVDLLELEEDVRRGHLPAEARLRGGPWCPDGERALGQIPALHEALDAPDARFVAHLRAGHWAPLSTLVTLTVLAAGLAQLLVLFALGRGLGTEQLGPVLDWTYAVATGYSPLVLDDAWWTPWLSQLSHSGPMHLFPNLAVLGYTGYRVERALGAHGYAVVAASALLGGVLAVTVAQPLPVIGSSILGYGLWAAQIAIGFRMGDTLPPGWRAYYGFGNLLLFAVLLVGSLTSEGVSHLAHLGGFVGGLLAALLVHPPCMVPRAQAAVAGRRLVLLAALLAAAPSALGPALRRVPVLFFGLEREVELERAGLTLRIPSRLLPPNPSASPYSATIFGMPAWTVSGAGDEFVFCGLAELDWAEVQDGDPLVGEGLAGFWTRLSGSGVTAVERAPPPPRAPGWTAHALDLAETDGTRRYLLVEHHLLRGRVLNRIGYVVALDEQGRSNPREALFEHMLGSVVVGEPGFLAEARDELSRRPTSERARYDLARALSAVGDHTQADALLEQVILEQGRLARDAVLTRAQLWAQVPAAFAATPRPAWLEPWLELYPESRSLQRAGVSWLAAVGRCPEARAFHEAFAAARPDAAELLDTAEAVMRCEAGLSPGGGVSPPGGAGR